MPRQERGQPRFLTAEEVPRLADAAGPDALGILVLAFTGLRFGELGLCALGPWERDERAASSGPTTATEGWGAWPMPTETTAGTRGLRTDSSAALRQP